MITRPGRRRGGSFREGVWGYALLAPWLIGLVTLTAGPMLASLYLSFTDYAFIGPFDWVGLSNYVHLFTEDQRFLQALEVTATYVAFAVPLELSFALLVAVLLNRRMRGASLLRAVYYLPSLLGGSVAIAILWRQVFGTDGLVQQLLISLGWADAPALVSRPETSLGTLIVLGVWQFGSPMVIFLAALRQIPGELYEAASLDGAGAFRSFVSITLPMLTPVIFFNLILRIIGSFQTFTPAFVVSGGTGGPTDSTLFYTLYLYQEAFTNFRMGYASAMAWILLVIIGVFTAANFALSKKWVVYDS
ncbi:carbohydrate ABC transporter permease [Jiangella endophytica]|uniref:carbohydrate ABC transporter permease n=1 Tax=Jiangella endophytica TaxID=1623398 RepID=UPI0018E59216|nr:sugar ABC transporter permease [Jiangella endophytica]